MSGCPSSTRTPPKASWCDEPIDEVGLEVRRAGRGRRRGRPRTPPARAGGRARSRPAPAGSWRTSTAWTVEALRAHGLTDARQPRRGDRVAEQHDGAARWGSAPRRCTRRCRWGRAGSGTSRAKSVISSRHAVERLVGPSGTRSGNSAVAQRGSASWSCRTRSSRRPRPSSPAGAGRGPAGRRSDVAARTRPRDSGTAAPDHHRGARPRRRPTAAGARGSRLPPARNGRSTTR